MTKKLFIYSSFFIVTIFFLGPLFFNIQSILHNCIHAIDFSIYQQAIYDISSNLKLNPFNTVRGTFIFLDHFDPILLLAALFIWFFGANPINLLIFEFLWYMGIVIFLIYIFRNNIKNLLIS